MTKQRQMTNQPRPAPTRSSRPVRQQAITELLADEGVASQTQLVKLLGDKGIKTTQATVSRDLDEIGAIKTSSASGELVYSLGNEPSVVISKAAQDHLQKVLGEWVHSVDKSINIIMLRTSPGAAHVVAAALDRSRFPGILGTVSGDDTVLAVVQQDHNSEMLFATLKELTGLMKN